MLISVHLTCEDWQEKLNGQIKQRGTCFQEIDSLLKVSETDLIISELRKKNGFYALIWEQGDKFYAAVDHIRSIPLFYGQKDSVFFLSDSADWVREQVGNTIIDEVSRDEFLLTGYVTGSETLYPDVKQLQAGEFLTVNKKDNEPVVNLKRYYRFLHTEPSLFDKQALNKGLDNVALSSIDNLIRYANGRQIVIPLSGGYDSRLIATLLKYKNYKNILTFTYGVLGNKESEYSQKVANSLGLKWHFIEYDSDLWSNAWNTEERIQYQKWASGWSSLPHMQDWLAVKILKNSNIVAQDCIFVPGHSGDFVAGSHIPEVAFIRKNLTLVDSCRLTYNFHYSISPSEESKKSPNYWYARIKQNMEYDDFCSSESLADSYEKWDWQERQAKFICNSVRVYEFYGYDWWLPLWDKDFVTFWQEIPLELRKKRLWYIEYVQKKYNSICAETIDNASDTSAVKMLVLSLLKRNQVLLKILKKVRNNVRRRTGLGTNFAIEAVFDREDLKSYASKGYSINGIFASEFIKSLNNGDF
ncbi:asparagine synthase family protein [Thalassolituus hydrocarboniclasticus]|uniref:asparagine synthase (glutamine-hydrolyzing) n=1 Tax=Thalassolituus hydrocarboniclasticus TaxID=2742796 RepID=A0ABY6ADA6_9GAMM|nr:asparagine synthetase B family protein [Thalassolituus hydrocarboniclasticus]UXD87954.1 asparagine synthase [Thalassolituus hydrocarboniclasticus]